MSPFSPSAARRKAKKTLTLGSCSSSIFSLGPCIWGKCSKGKDMRLNIHWLQRERKTLR